MSVTYTNRLALEPKYITTGLSADNVTATGNGTSFDRNSIDSFGTGGPYEEGILLAQVEQVTGGPSAVSVALRIEHSDNDTDFTAITDLAKVSAATVNFTAVGIKTLAFRLPGLKRYVRASVSDVTLTGGTTPAVKLRVLFVLDSPRQV